MANLGFASTLCYNRFRG